MPRFRMVMLSRALPGRDADRRLPHLGHGRRLVEHADPRFAEHLDELVAAVPVPVVVPEHREDGHRDSLHGLGEPPDLGRVAVTCQVAGEEDEVRLAAGVGEHAGEALVSRPACMDVSCGGNLDHSRTVP